MTGFELAILGGEVWYLSGIITGFERKVKIFWEVCPLYSKCVYLIHPVNVYFLSTSWGCFWNISHFFSFWYVCGLSVTIVLDFMDVFKSHQKYKSCFDYAKHSLMTKKKKKKSHLNQEKKCQGRKPMKGEWQNSFLAASCWPNPRI